MTPQALVLLLVALMPACGPKAQEVVRGSTEADGPSPLLTGADLRIAPAVDTTAAFDRETIGCLRRFFAQKLQHDVPNDWWYAPDMERFGPLYSELLYAEYDDQGDLRYWPTLLTIHSAHDGKERLLRVQWAAEDSAGTSGDARYIFDFLVRPMAEGPRLSLPIGYNTQGWEQRQRGPVRYICSPAHHFSEEQAAEQVAVIERLSALFEVPAFPITYYSFADPADLFRAKGFQQHPLMYTLPSGGMVDPGWNVYSGNNKDIYTHEIVHLFAHRRFGPHPDLLGEGLATLIGGSVERDYAWHRTNMEQLLSDPAVDLSDRCNPYQQDNIAGDTNVPYMVGALLCERILRRAGKEGLFRVMEQGADPWPALATYGITRANLTAELRKEVGLPVVVW